jgi:hypothetical protein
MTEQAMNDALHAILDEAEKLLKFDLPPEAEKIVDLIYAIARYQLDVRTEAEAGKANSNVAEEADYEHPTE